MNTARANAYAKLNLTLDVCGVEDGYHLLDSLAVTVDLFDRAVATKRKDGRVRVRAEGGEVEPIERAAERFFEVYKGGGADITVYKNVPVGAGMGGSSTDVAATLLALAKLYEIADMGGVKSLADELGSDTGYLLCGGAARLRGRGERVEYSDMPPLFFLVLVPPSRVDTAGCFQLFDRMGKEFPPRTERAIEAFRGGAAWAAKLFGNHLTEAAVSLCPEIGKALFALRALSPLCACMTGSGSACYAAFETRELAEWAQSRYQGNCRTFVLKSMEKSLPLFQREEE